MNEEILQNLNERLDNAIERGRVILEDEELQERLNELKHRTEGTIRQNPIKSVLLGVAVGFIASKIFGCFGTCSHHFWCGSLAIDASRNCTFGEKKHKTR